MAPAERVTRNVEKQITSSNDNKAMEKACGRLGEVVKKVLVNPPDLSEKGLEERFEKSVQIIEGQVKVGNTVKNLENVLRELKDLSFVDALPVDGSDKDAAKVLDSCRDVEDISQTRGGTYHEIWFSPSGNPSGGYFLVFPDSSQHIDIIPL